MIRRLKKWIFLIALCSAIAAGVSFYLHNRSATISDMASTVQTLRDEYAKINEKPNFTFIVMGDNDGVNPVLRKIIAEVNASDAAFAVHVADISKDGSRESFAAVKKELDRLTVPYYPTVGNNDLDSNKSTALWQEFFGDDTYYSFDKGNAHFVVLNNALRTIGFDDAQQAWLRNDLDANTKPLTFLFWHRAFGTPFEDLTGDDETPVSRRNNADTLAILQDYDIEHIFTGHVHRYFPYKLVTPNRTELDVTITGGGGAAPHEIFGTTPAPDYHYLKVRVFDDRAEIEKKEIVL